MAKDTSAEKLRTSMEQIAASLLFERIIKRCASLMKVRRLPRLEETIEQLLMSDEELKTRWQKLCHVYWHDRRCDDAERIENEMYQCFDALMSDKRGVMIGLDSESSLRSLLITSMRICSEPSFTLEIRIGLGGTEDSLNLRAPSYAVAGVHVLEQLLELRQKFSPGQPELGEDIPTKMLISPPILTFFCAWRAAVTINKLDKNLANKNARDILQLFKNYIDHSYSNLSNYVRYELDDENTFKEGLLTRIIEHYNSEYPEAIERTKRELIEIALRRGSDEQGSIRYASMHLVMAKDIMDKNVPLHVLDENENNIHGDEISSRLYDCIITIGGSIEEKFNLVRDAVRQVFIEKSIASNEDDYHFPLSIRMLSKAGAQPVYYRQEKFDITIDDIREGRVTSSQLMKIPSKAIAEDLAILKEDVGRNLLKPIWNRIPKTEANKTSSWRNIVLNLASLCLDVWGNHAKKDNRIDGDITQPQAAFEQVCHHYNLSDILDDNTRSILKSILVILEQDIGSSFGTAVPHLDRTWKRQISNSNIFRELDNLLGSFLIDLVRGISPKN